MPTVQDCRDRLEVVHAAQIRLNELMAVEDLSLNFTTSDTSITVNPELLFEKLLDETLIKNTGLQLSAKNKIISEYDYKLIVSRSYPYLKLRPDIIILSTLFIQVKQKTKKQMVLITDLHSE